MRGLILLLSVVVVGLSVLILLAQPETTLAGDTFPAGRFIADAERGERATYRDETGETLTFEVEGAVPADPDHGPRIQIRRTWRDPSGKLYAGGSEVYEHLPTKHGLFPLMAPADPDGLDRVWVWTRIRRADLLWHGRRRKAWRVDLIDPALPPEGGADEVVAWMDESVPVFGLLRFQRGGRTWDLAEESPR